MRTRLRRALRDIRAAIDSGDPAKVKDALRNTISLVDKMAGKKLIHRNTAGRYKSRLASRVAEVGRGLRQSPGRAGRHAQRPLWASTRATPAQIHHQPLEQHPRIASGALQLEVRAEQRLDRGRHAPRVATSSSSPARTRRAAPGSW